MGNDTRSLLIGGAVSMVVLIISIGVFIFNTANSTTYESMSQFSAQEVNSFNSKFAMYDGLQDGIQVKNLIALLISNSTVYEKEGFARLPQLIISKNNDFSKIGLSDATRPVEENERSEYVNNLSKIRNKISTSKKYVIELEYANSGIIDKINILPQDM